MDQSVSDKPQAFDAQFGEAKLIGIGLSRTTQLPGKSSNNGLITRNIGNIKLYFILLDIRATYLAINQSPSFCIFIPILYDLIINLQTRSKIDSESNPISSQDALVLGHGIE